jgi:hypothetical protein
VSLNLTLRTEKIKLSPKATGNTIKKIGTRYIRFPTCGHDPNRINASINTPNCTRKFTADTTKLVKGSTSRGNQTFFSSAPFAVIEIDPALIEDEIKFQKMSPTKIKIANI